MTHFPCSVKSLTGQILVAQEDMTPEGYDEYCCMAGSLDATETLPIGGQTNCQGEANPNHTFTFSFQMRK